MFTLITNVFPQEMETGNIHKGIIAGKLNGAIPAVTPRGSRYECMSMSVAINGNDSPIIELVKLQQFSTTSIQ